MKSDTIAAIATALSNAGIGIIRISGKDSIAIADQIFKTKSGRKVSDMESHTVHYGHIVDDGTVIDEVMLLVMKAPRSYTMEDSVVIDCHGGIIVTKKVLETVIRHGARPAEPGEFTKRAFLNGRIDLSQAEAVIDIIHAKNDLSLKNSMRQLRGNVLTKIKDIRSNILLDVAFIEAALDDPEHISLEGFNDKLSTNVSANLKSLNHLLASADNGRMIKEGIQTVILGKPNAGKSSLMNLLVGEDRAIVTDIAGTTRDTLEETIQLNGISLNVIDTAGIRETEDAVDKIGVEKAKKSASEADLIIYVVDASVPLDQNDYEIIEFIQDKKAIVLLNKSDLTSVIDDVTIKELTKKEVIRISAKENTGIEIMEKTITSMFFKGDIEFNDEIYITSIRHKAALAEAIKSLEQVNESILMGMPEDFYSIDLMKSYEVLGTIIGESVDEDLVNTIFKEFCMGK